VRVFGALARNSSAVSRSAAKWFLPPGKYVVVYRGE
jgi:hypothetical protein